MLASPMLYHCTLVIYTLYQRHLNSCAAACSLPFRLIRRLCRKRACLSASHVRVAQRAQREALLPCPSSACRATLDLTSCHCFTHRMGCGGSKVADAVESSGSSSPSGGGNAGDDIETVQGSDRVRTFRERRLSMSQQQHTNARPRRRSIYGNDGDTDMQPSVGQSPCSTCI